MVRVKAASDNYARVVQCHAGNGDERLYNLTRIASFTKGLAHDGLGHVVPSAFDALLKALSTGTQADFNAIPLGGTRPFLNPQAGRAFDLQGIDSHLGVMPPAPTFSSAEQAGEIVENYWMAILRDVPFSQYASSPLAAEAAADLGALSNFRGLKTAPLLFRGLSQGCSTGPYISQFLYLPCPMGAALVDQRLTPPIAGENFMTSWDEYLQVQRGVQPTRFMSYEPLRRHILNGRDLSHWVHVDVIFQAYFHGLLILLNVDAPVKSSNPYTNSPNQAGFVTFGLNHIAGLLGEVASRALKAAWFQKWYVHRRLRPEVFAARLDRHLRGFASYPFHPDALASSALGRLNATYGSYLLPQAFPEGSPTHPSYPAGHATVAGACTTLLKAWFNESYVLLNPMVPNADGTGLVPYVGPPLTVGGELNKLASNVAIGRNIAGVHWQSDATASLRLGEQVAISILRDQKGTFAESFSGWTFTSFDGQVITV